MLRPPYFIRRFRPSDLRALTTLINRAYADLGAEGLNFVGATQDERITKERVARGECYVVEYSGRLIGTITFQPPGTSTGTEWYTRQDIAAFQQLCVDPDYQRVGVGSALMAIAEARAVECNAAELALDTAKPATELIEFYRRRGFRDIESVRWPHANYVSVIMSKPVRAAAVDITRERRHR